VTVPLTRSSAYSKETKNKTNNLANFIERNNGYQIRRVNSKVQGMYKFQRRNQQMYFTHDGY
jgi:hypothetical protein